MRFPVPSGGISPWVPPRLTWIGGVPIHTTPWISRVPLRSDFRQGVFLLIEIEYKRGIQVGSVVKKRRKKMRKHKQRKLLKKQRHKK